MKKTALRLRCSLHGDIRSANGDCPTCLKHEAEHAAIMKTNVDVASLVDQLGMLGAELAPLLKREADLKADLAKLGKGTYDGTTFRATVSIYNQPYLDQKAIKALLSEEVINANTRKARVVKVQAKAKRNPTMTVADRLAVAAE